MILPVRLALFSPLTRLAGATGRTSDSVAQRLGTRMEQLEFGRNQSSSITFLLWFSFSNL